MGVDGFLFTRSERDPDVLSVSCAWADRTAGSMASVGFSLLRHGFISSFPGLPRGVGSPGLLLLRKDCTLLLAGSTKSKFFVCFSSLFSKNGRLLAVQVGPLFAQCPLLAP